jgi:hypothetical protein
VRAGHSDGPGVRDHVEVVARGGVVVRAAAGCDPHWLAAVVHLLDGPQVS